VKRSFPAVWRYLAVNLIVAASISAAPVACSSSGSFADLLDTNDDGGCYIADKLFSGFSFQSSATGSSIALAADQFTFTTVANAPSALGFQFAGAIGALQNSSMRVDIGWLITGPGIRSDHLLFAASAFGTGTARIDETYCRGGAVEDCPPEDTRQLSVFTGQNLGTKLVDSALFAPVNVFGVSKTITVTAGPLSFANISNVTQTVDQVPQVPEPATTLFIGTGLLSVWMMRRRRP